MTEEEMMKDAAMESGLPEDESEAAVQDFMDFERILSESDEL